MPNYDSKTTGRVSDIAYLSVPSDVNLHQVVIEYYDSDGNPVEWVEASVSIHVRVPGAILFVQAPYSERDRVPLYRVAASEFKFVPYDHSSGTTEQGMPDGYTYQVFWEGM